MESVPGLQDPRVRGTLAFVPSELAGLKSEDLLLGFILLGFTAACASRVLGFALLYSPSVGGSEALAAEILGCNRDHDLLAGLAHIYVYGLIRVCESPVIFCQLPY